MSGIKNTITAAPSVLTAAANNTKDTFGHDTHVRIPANEFAQLAEARQKLETLTQIIRATEPTWTPTHKITSCLMYLDDKPVGNVIPSQHTPNTLAAALNVSVGTARNTLKQMAGAKVLGYDSKATPVNRYGEPLERGVMADKTRGDRFERVVTITLPAKPVIKPLTATATQAKDKAVKKQQRDELRELRTKLAALECPECGQVGHLQVVCGECGCKLDATLETSDSDFSSETPATSLETSDSDFSSTPAGATLETPKIDVCNKENTKFDVSTFSTEEGVTHDEPPPTSGGPDVNPPAANISPAQLIALIGNKGQFIATRYHSKQRAERGPVTWLNGLAALDALEQGHNIALDSAGQFAIIDIDAGAGEFVGPANAPMIYRVNAPNRAKFIVRCDDVQVIAKRKNASGTREIEVKREAVVIGIHETGTQILCKHNGEPIPVMSMAQIDALVNSFVPPPPKPIASAKTVTPLSVPKTKTNTSAEGDVKAAINWWNEQPANVAEVERLVASCPTKGKAFALRTDDKTPSTVYRPAQEGHTTATWRDFGAGISRDAFDMYVTLTGCDKRRFIGEVVKAWRAANMRPAAPPPTPPATPTTSPNVAKWLEAATVGADNISAGNPVWIPKRAMTGDDAAVLSAKLPASIKLVDVGASYYQLRHG